jgi:outer membrane scaffolding protein for murein synthesis (MipA/OmpV family)
VTATGSRQVFRSTLMTAMLLSGPALRHGRPMPSEAHRHSCWDSWNIGSIVANGKGNVVSLGGEYTLPLTSKWSTTFATGISFGDGTYMRDNFTVPPLAPSFIRNTTYVSPKAGARDLTVSADFEYRADAHWRWNTVIGFTQSLAVSQQGAFVKVRSAPFVSTGIRYRF